VHNFVLHCRPLKATDTATGSVGSSCGTLYVFGCHGSWRWNLLSFRREAVVDVSVLLIYCPARRRIPGDSLQSFRRENLSYDKNMWALRPVGAEP
jgi:hypothetical protein